MELWTGALRPLALAASLFTASCVGAHVGGGGGGGGGDGGSGQVSVSPKSAFLASGGTQTFTCSVGGAASTCSWSVVEGSSGGAISSLGVYTAPGNGGTYHLVATIGGASAEATVSVAGPAAAVAVTPAAAYVAPGASFTFKATVKGPSDTSVTWSVTEGAGGGTVTTAGVYTAPSAGGSYHVVATSVANPAESGTATVTVSATPVVVVSVSPDTVSVGPAGTAKLTATVTGSSDTAVNWSVSEGAAGGSIDSTGTWTAPSASGTYHLVATSHADSSKSDTAIATVQPFNTWYDVTGGVDLSGFSGAQFVLVDPVRPRDLYLFVAYAGVYKSTDFGQTWNHISINDAGTLKSGRPWASAIDPNPSRDPSTPPTMYTTAGYGINGLWKSTDGGMNWNQVLPPSMRLYCFNGLPEVYGMAVEPGNNQHILLGFRQNWCTGQSDTGLLETQDGGATWVEHKPPAGFGQGHYLAFIDSNTWLAVAIAYGAPGGTWRTTTAGRVGGVPDPSAWTKTGDIYHNHGGAQMYVDPVSKVVYNPAIGGIFRSTDGGATWKNVYNQNMSGMIATPNYLYASFLYLGSSASVYYVRSPRSDGSTWSAYTGSLPFDSGWVWGTSTFDGSHWILVTPNQSTGIWRYVEAP